MPNGDQLSEIKEDKEWANASHSPNQIKQDKSSATFKLVVASIFNNVLIDLWQCCMEIDDVKSQLIDSWQCLIDKVDLKLLSSCSIDHPWQCWSDLDMTLSFVDHQLVVASVSWISKADLDFSDIWSQIFVHFEADSNFSWYLSAILKQLNKMCSASQMVATEHKPLHKSNSSTFRFIVGFKQQHQSLTHKSWQRQLFVNDVLIDLWQCQMVDKKGTSYLWQCRLFVNKMIAMLFQISVRAWPSKTMYCKEAQLVVELSFGQNKLIKLILASGHNEPSRLINGLVGHSKPTKQRPCCPPQAHWAHQRPRWLHQAHWAHQPCPWWPHKWFSTRSRVPFQWPLSPQVDCCFSFWGS